MHGELLCTLASTLADRYSHLTVPRSHQVCDQCLYLTPNLEISAETGGQSISSVRSAIDAALSIYAADRTGLVDFALGSAGGTVVHTRCTRTYNKGATAFSVFGIPLLYFRKSPNTILEPNNQPGDCWAFEGAEGQAVVRLAVPVHISGVSLEHIPRSLSIHGNIDSAPREFQIKVSLFHCVFCGRVDVNCSSFKISLQAQLILIVYLLRP
ncbi:unnamed protein product [Schistocephalus solidus]|uniref:SUN domain-containing protein n=1 Tax=Schistocephalus solidus TaxID=70667 RepID=A0A183SJN5_SCHSO|nr:unnamed protein product [Schistocephalus solidus]